MAINNLSQVHSPQTAAGRRTPGKICFGILGFIYAIIAYQLPASIVATVITETGNVAWAKASILVQFAVGFSLSVAAYVSAWERSFKIGMLTCYGLVIGSVISIGAYTLITSV